MQEISLNALIEAIGAFEKKKWRTVISLLEGWPITISILVRSEGHHALELDAKEMLVRALNMLGHAYFELEDYESAEQVLRVSIRLLPESQMVAPAFFKMGELLLMAERPSEAISYLRRVLSLGESSEFVYALLAKSYAACGKLVAAGICAELACKYNIHSEMRDLKYEMQEIFGGSWDVVEKNLKHKNLILDTVPFKGSSK